MAAVNVKVSVKKLIAALNAKIAECKKLVAAHEKAEADFKKAREKYNADVKKISVKNHAVQNVTIRNYNCPEGMVIVEAEYLVPKNNIPVEPERAEVPGFMESSWRNTTSTVAQIAEMENAVRLLQMTDDEFVNASTYKSICKYL